MDAVSYFNGRAEFFDASYMNKPSFRERFVLWTSLIDKYAKPGGTALDIGCGSGVFAVYAAEKVKSVVALDGSEEMLDVARRKASRSAIHNVNFLLSRVEDLSVENLGRFDLIICSSVLDYSVDLSSDLDRIRTLLNPGGILLASLPNGRSLFRAVEGITFRLFGWPKNRRFIHNIMAPERARRELKQRHLSPVDVRYYASPLRNRFGIDLGFLQPAFSNLFVFVSCNDQAGASS